MTQDGDEPASVFSRGLAEHTQRRLSPSPSMVGRVRPTETDR